MAAIIARKYFFIMLIVFCVGLNYNLSKMLAQK